MLAEGSRPWVAAAVALAVAASLAVILDYLPIPALVLVAPLPLLLSFFRDPDRTVGDGIVSPADGRVTGVDDGDGATIEIFMGPWDVHVNRAPLQARVADRRHEPGGHVPAFDKDADTNERMVWDLETDVGSIQVVQIAGAVARRIQPYVDAGDDLEKGQRVGIIRFGSRVDLHLPDGVEPTVEEGDRVQAATTTVARAPDGGDG